ncbi:MAG: DUF2500 domain-containing protein [Clostridiales bacterium]|nr:DUF2500 domain-containing protein [Clostridiales bacterium]
MGFYIGNPFQIMFVLISMFIIGTFIVTIIKGISSWHKNNQSPRLTVNAEIVSKREEVHRHRHDSHTTLSTTYYICFQVESGDRMELSVNGSEYGLLAEGDYGRLSFQGTRYLGFERSSQ